MKKFTMGFAFFCGFITLPSLASDGDLLNILVKQKNWRLECVVNYEAKDFDNKKRIDFNHELNSSMLVRENLIFKEKDGEVTVNGKTILEEDTVIGVVELTYVKQLGVNRLRMLQRVKIPIQKGTFFVQMSLIDTNSFMGILWDEDVLSHDYVGACSLKPRDNG